MIEIENLFNPLYFSRKAETSFSESLQKLYGNRISFRSLGRGTYYNV